MDFPVNQFGSVLATRRRGKAAAEALQRHADAHPGKFLITFQGCETASATWLQEFIPVVHSLRDRVAFICMTDDIVTTIDWTERSLR
jgi:hypothetical protein